MMLKRTIIAAAVASLYGCAFDPKGFENKVVVGITQSQKPEACTWSKWKWIGFCFALSDDDAKELSELQKLRKSAASAPQ